MPRYRFGRFELQPDERRLLSADTPIPLRPHAFDLLVALVERSGHLVTKEELLARVWDKVVVEENTLQAHVAALRKLIGHAAIATITGRGYRFTADVAQLDSQPARPNHNLPHALTVFVGRDKEIADVQHLLGTTRLLTLTGTGGCGKTRLALQAGMRQVDAYADGVWLVELATLGSAALIGQTIAKALNIKEWPGKTLTDTLCASLAERRLLLILDNAEHLIDGCAHIAHELLQRCAGLAVMCTSRERLGITGELTYRVPSLAVPDARRDVTLQQVGECESVRLFVDRARLQRPEFMLSDANAGVLSAICRRLDGIALAIELAAARVHSMSLEDLCSGLDERFRLLTGGSRTALPRHRTLRSLIDWSYELLSEAEKTMLRRVSVFSGGWTLEAAERVCRNDGIEAAKVLDLLTSLSDKNLLLAQAQRGATRYGMLETVRQYARDRMDAHEEESVKRAHLAYLVEFAEKALPELSGREQAHWLDRYEMEHDNLRSALSFAATQEGESPDGLNLAAASWRFWVARGHLSQGLSLISEQLSHHLDPADRRPRAKCLHGAATLALLMGEFARARRLSEEAVETFRLLGDRRGTAVSLGGLGNVLSRLGEYATARTCLEEGIAILREVGERIDPQLNNLGVVLQRMGDLEAARPLHEEALALRRDRGDRVGIAHSLGNLGDLAHRTGALVHARELFEAAGEIAEEVGDQRMAASTAINLAYVMCEQGDQKGAQALLEKSIPTAMTLGDRERVADALYALGNALALRDPRKAARLWGAGARLREQLEIAETSLERSRDEAWIARGRSALNDDAVFDAGWREGRKMTLERAVQFALEVAGNPTEVRGDNE